MSGTHRGWFNARWQEMVLAGALLTRFPMPRLSADLLARPGDGVWAYPLVGVIVGAAGGLVFWASSTIGLPAACGAVAALATTCLVSGCLHEDGLADFADGLGGGRTREAKLEIMRDSQIGTYGAAALITSFVARWAALGALLPVAGLCALVVAHSLARGLLGLIFVMLAPARADGLAASAGHPNWPAVLPAIVGPFLVALVLLPMATAVIATLAAGGAVLIVGWLARRYLGGHTGDVFGAAEQMSEIAALWTIICWWGVS